jgi:cytochrome c-type biogenesis protein CcmF
VENASFMPWLAGTALLHSAVVVEKRDSLKSWTILLAIIAFSFSLIGTFLVRSGSLTSVHAFAVDPERGVFILLLLAIAIGGSLTLFALRGAGAEDSGVFAPISARGAGVEQSVSFGRGRRRALWHLVPADGRCVRILGLGGCAVLQSDFRRADRAVFPGGAVRPADGLEACRPAGRFAAFVGGRRRGHCGHRDHPDLIYGGRALAALCLGLAAWLVMGALVELADRLKLFRAPLATIWSRAINLPRSSYGMTLAHAGLGFVLAGIIVSTEWRAEIIKRMIPGDHVEIAGYDLQLAAVTAEKGANYLADRAEFIVTRGGKEIARLYPEQRLCPVRPEDERAAIRTTGSRPLCR